MRRSWLEWLLDAIDRVPGPRWSTYAGAFVVWMLLVASAGYLDHTFPFPWISPVLAVGPLLGLGLLWATQSLSGFATRTLAALEPILTIGPDERETVARDLTRTPPIWAAVALVVGTVSGVDSLITTPESWGVPASWPPVTAALGIVVAVLNTTVILVFVARLLHQTLVIDRIHRGAVRIDLSRLEPLYGFAAYLSRAAILLIGIAIGGFSLVILAVARTFTLATSDYFLFGATLVVSVVAFVIPVRGLHDRISEEKDRRLSEVHASLATVLAEMERRVAVGDLEGAGRLNDAISAANAAVAVVAHAPTWPWRPETLRSFVSAVLLPVVLWAMITVLGRVLEA